VSSTSIATYRRTVPAPIERVWENVYDWEHLPWLHCSSFRDIALLEAGKTGWKARIALQPEGAEIVLDLRTERDAGRYVSATVEGPGAGTEIWTTLTPDGDSRGTRVEVEFLVPGIAPERAPAIGEGYVRLYTRLWDEDEGMIVRRETLLGGARAARARSRAPVSLGPVEALRARLPAIVRFDGLPFRVVEVEGKLFAHATLCPHLLGPLDSAEVEDGCVRCPWHGYRFDVRTGASAEGRRLRLAPAPRVEIEAGEALLVFPA
jgi:nitrite reductase/ring-hydroxylating ferredoxin subunit